MVKNDNDRFLELFDSLHLNLMNLDRQTKTQEPYSYENFSNLLFKLRSKHNWLNGPNYFFLKTCSKIRNIISHNNYLQPFQEFNPEFIEKLEGFNARFFSTIEEHAIKRNNINHLTWETDLTTAINKLKEFDFPCLPILEDGYALGIFSQSILVDYLSNQKECILNSSIKLKDLKKYCELKKHLDKTITFVDRNKNISEVFDLFSDYFADGDKLILVFITEEGYYDQRIFGMYTVWDFLKFN
jgi:predicted transcriptional regulator